MPPTGPFTAATGFRLTAVGPDRVEGVAEVGPEQHQPHGIVHGGAWCAIVETAASIGAQSFATARGLGIVGVHNGTNFLRPVRSGRMDVVAVPLHQGRTQQLWDVRITDEGGRVVATGQVRLVHLERGEG